MCYNKIYRYINYTDVCLYYALPGGLAPVGRQYIFIGFGFKI